MHLKFEVHNAAKNRDIIQNLRKKQHRYAKNKRHACLKVFGFFSLTLAVPLLGEKIGSQFIILECSTSFSAFLGTTGTVYKYILTTLFRSAQLNLSIIIILFSISLQLVAVASFDTIRLSSPTFIFSSSSLRFLHLVFFWHLVQVFFSKFL